MTAQEAWKMLMDIVDCESVPSRLLRVAHDIEVYGEIGREERRELESIRYECEELAEKIGEVLA